MLTLREPRRSDPYNIGLPYTMEFVVPVLAAGGMYLASQQERDLATHECARKTSNNTPTVAPLPNYPTQTPVTQQNDVNYYGSANAATDRYFQQEVAIEKQGAVPGQYLLLSGEHTDAAAFTHSNMQPFFGGSVKQPRTMPRGNESALDNLTGAGSQYVKKTEKAPLFQPRPDAHWANGMPSTSDFVQSRQVAGRYRTNDKPWESVNVGPGVGEGFSSDGAGGFNSALAARDQWQPKTVDELRAKTNPKLTFDGVTLGGTHFAGKRGIQAHVQKNNQETAFELGPSRYLTTGGAEVGPSGRPAQELPHQSRIETTRENWGTGASTSGGLQEVRGTYEAPKREQLNADGCYPGAAVSAGAGAPGAATASYGRDGHVSTPNSRALTGGRSAGFLGSAIAAVKSLMTPFHEELRPTRRADVVGHCSLGLAGSDVSAGTARSAVDNLRITKKEVAVANCRTPIAGAQTAVQNQRVYDEQSMHTNRGETLRAFTPAGGATAGSSKPRDHSGDYATSRGPDKENTLAGRTNHGTGALFTGQYASVRPGDRLDHSAHVLGVGSQIGEPPSAATIGNQSHHIPLHSGTAERLHDNVQAQFNANPYAHSVA
jgi:hypothetical protein